MRHVLAAVAATTLGILAALSFFTPLSYCQRVNSDWLLFCLYDGRARLFRLDVTTGPIIVSPHRYQPTMKITPVKPSGPPLPQELAGPDRVRAAAYWERRITLGNLRRTTSFGGAWRREYTIPRPRYGSTFKTGVFMSYFRIPAWLPAAALLIGPIRAAIGVVIRQRRRRNSLCTTCGYDLRNLPQLRCPECGTTFDSEHA